MELIDTHCHLYAEEFFTDIDAVMQRSATEGVSRFYLPAIDSSTHNNMILLEEKFAGKCFAMMGLHPCSVNDKYKDELKVVEDWLDKRKFAAVGEIGLDFYWDKTFAQQQYTAFNRQMELAVQYKLPIIIHTRNAMAETIRTVKEYALKGVNGIFHCFSGTYEEAMQIIGMGFYLGIGGVLTYKNAGLAKVLDKIDIKYVVLETDAPYLTPVPYRGKRNESSYLKFVADKLAEIKNCTVEEIAAVTTANAIKIFK
jgi:TatD DNase family protein